jgi:hypothetical protein
VVLRRRVGRDRRDCSRRSVTQKYIGFSNQPFQQITCAHQFASASCCIMLQFPCTCTHCVHVPLLQCTHYVRMLTWFLLTLFLVLYCSLLHTRSDGPRLRRRSGCSRQDKTRLPSVQWAVSFTRPLPCEGWCLGCRLRRGCGTTRPARTVRTFAFLWNQLCRCGPTNQKRTEGLE